MAAQRDLEIAQFDVRTAFLYDRLDEYIFMRVPEGLIVPENGVKVVCKLERALYSLKQASRCWNKTFSEFLKCFNLVECDTDSCVYRGRVNERAVYLALYVDDGLVVAETQETFNMVINYLKGSFEISVCKLEVFVGLQVVRDRANRSIFLHQESYVNQILSRFNMKNANSVSIPADPQTVLIPNEDNEKIFSTMPYREAVGSLLFLATVSRPDICFAVSTVSRHVNNPSQMHWQAVKRIFKYLKGTAKLGICYSNRESESGLIGFSDADNAGDVETRRSTTGYIFELFGGPVTWASERQRMVTLNTTESEYVAACAAAKEAIWLRSLLNDIE